MRPILTTDEIKKVFKLAFNEINDRDDDIISWEKAYKIFVEVQNKSFNNFFNTDYLDDKKLKEIIEESNLNGEDEEKILVFLVVMSLIAQASSIKNLAKKIVEQYEG